MRKKIELFLETIKYILSLRPTEFAKEILFNLFCAALLGLIVYLAYAYIYCDYVARHVGL